MSPMKQIRVRRWLVATVLVAMVALPVGRVGHRVDDEREPRPDPGDPG
jgi:hypothetical protein